MAGTSSVGIVGAGLIGRSWAHVFARAGWQVRVWDPSAAQRDAAAARIAASLGELEAHGLVDDAAAASARVEIVDTLAAAVRDASYVQESGPETLDAKRATFAALDAAAPPDACSRRRRRRSSPRGSPKASPGGRAAWSPIRSIRRTWCRWSSCAARPGPTPRRRRAPAP